MPFLDLGLGAAMNLTGFQRSDKNSKILHYQQQAVKLRESKISVMKF